MSPVRKRRSPLIAVHTGQVYKYKPTTKGAHTKYLRIVGIIGAKSDQPKVKYRQISKAGNLTKPKSSLPNRTPLAWNGTQWVFPFGELVQGE